MSCTIKPPVAPPTGCLWGLPYILTGGIALKFLAAAADSEGIMQLMVNGVGTPTSTHVEPILMDDHEGIYRTFDTDEPVWKGGRVVENKSTADWSQWYALDCTIETGITDPLGGNTAVRITATANGGRFLYYGDTVATGETAVFSGYVRKVFLVDAAPQIGIEIGYSAASSFSPETTWGKRFSGAESYVSTRERGGVRLTKAGDIIELWGPQLEDTTGRQVVTDGTELVTNGTFANWTSDDPDNWTVNNEDASNYITEHVDGARIVSDNTAAIQMGQSIATVGKYYVATFVKSNHVAGEIRTTLGSLGTHNIPNSDANGTFTSGVFEATAATLYFYRDGITGPTDYVMESISIQEVTFNGLTVPSEYVAKDTGVGAELIVNTSFENWTGGIPYGWAVGGNDANNYIEEHTDGLRLVSDDTSAVYIRQSVLTIGEEYIVEVTKSNHVSGFIRTVEDMVLNNIAGSDSNGTFTIRTGASATTHFYLYRDSTGNTDYVIESISIKEASSGKVVYCYKNGITVEDNVVTELTPTPVALIGNRTIFVKGDILSPMPSLAYNPAATNDLTYYSPTVAQLATKGGTPGVADATPESWLGVSENQIQFPPNLTASTYAYMQALEVLGEPSCFSCLVKMDDNSVPRPSATQTSSYDFGIVLDGAAGGVTYNEVQHLGYNIYRVVGELTSTTGGASRNCGVIQYLGHSGKGFKVTGFQHYQNKTLPQVRNLPPIVTTGAAGSIDRTVYTYDIANHDDEQGMYFLEAAIEKGDVTADILGGSIFSFYQSKTGPMYWNPAGNFYTAYDGTTNASAYHDVPIVGEHNHSVVYEEGGSFVSILDGEEGATEPAYDGSFYGTKTAINLFVESSYPQQLRNLMRYQGGTYQDLKDKAHVLTYGTPELVLHGLDFEEESY